MNQAFRSDESRVNSIAMPLLLLVIGFFGIALAQSDFFRAVPGDLGDARFNGLILEHVYRWVRGVDGSLWSPGFFYPFPGALAFSDTHFGTVGIYMLLRAAGLSPEVAYTGWFTFAYLANYLSCHYVLRRFGLSHNGSAVGAFLFAFSMPVAAQVAHAQLGYRFAVPLALLAWKRWMSEGRASQFAWVGAWVTLQFYCSIYIGYFLLLLLGGYVLAAYLVRSDASRRSPHRVLLDLIADRRESDFRRSVVVLFGCAVALVALFIPYIHFSHEYGFVRHPFEIASMLPRPGSYLLADLSQLWSPLGQAISGIPMRSEHQMFFGAGAMLLAAAAVRQSSYWVRVSAVALLLTVALTIEIGGYSLYMFIARLPLADSIRAVGRVVLVMAFPLALLAAAGFDRLVRGIAGRRWVGVFAAAFLALVMLVECIAIQSGRVPLPVWRNHLAAFMAKVPDNLPADAIVFVPRQVGQPSYMTELDGMSIGQLTNRSTLNGYSGNQPPGHEGSSSPCDDIADRIGGYVEFMRLGEADFDALARRVVVVGEGAQCGALRLSTDRSHFSARLPDSVYEQIHVGITSVQPSGVGQLLIGLEVRNDSDTILASISDSHQPIRFAWRFVRMGDVATDDGGWDTRHNLPHDIPAYSSSRVGWQIDPPERAGRYVLEVTMVQEYVAWFHDRGMVPARTLQTVEIRHGEQAIVIR